MVNNLIYNILKFIFAIHIFQIIHLKLFLNNLRHKVNKNVTDKFRYFFFFKFLIK